MRPNNVPFSTLWCASIFFCFLTGAARIINSSEPSQDALHRPPNSDVYHQPAADLTESAKIKLGRLIEEKRYVEFENQLPLATLGRNDRKYFEGILADRLNQPSRAIELLEEALPEIVKSDHRRAVITLNALGQDYFMIGRYSQATKQYATVLRSFTGSLDLAERRTVQDFHDTFALLGNASPQSISGKRSFTVTTKRNALGDLTVPLRIRTSIEWWVLDTGASISTITRSTARRLGLKISKRRSQIQAATGEEVPLSTAIIPELTFGTAVVHNLVVLVIEDKELNFKLGTQGTYQIDGILGYPVLAALESLTVASNEMQVGPSENSSSGTTRLYSSGTTRLYAEELTPLIVASSGKAALMFLFDTGNSSVELTARFLKEFPNNFASLTSERRRAYGVGRSKAFKVYHLPELELSLGSAKAKFKNVTLFYKNRGYLVDKLYGNLGQGLLSQFQSYTIDFTRMQLVLRNPAPH